MRVEFGFFEGDELLQKGLILITNKQQFETEGILVITHRLLEEMAEIVIEVISDGQRHIKSTLHMPIHESDVWESIELTQFTFAFKCTLDAYHITGANAKISAAQFNRFNQLAS